MADEDEHWWDGDPAVRERNVAFEAKLGRLIGADRVETPQRRQGDDDVLNNPWIKLVLQVGVPATIAIFLVFKLSTNVDLKLDQNLQTLQSHATFGAAAVSSINERLADAERQQAVMIDLLRVQCVNSAKSSVERGECLRAGR